MADVKKLAEELTKLTVLEVNELKNVLKDEYGIEPAAAAVAVAAGPAADAGAAADEKTEFTVNLKDGGAQKVAVIKAVKEKMCIRDSKRYHGRADALRPARGLSAATNKARAARHCRNRALLDAPGTS